LQTSESLTLAEVYLMMGKPTKLQLEYDWLAVLGPESQAPTAQGQTALSRSSPSALHQQRLLSCLLRLISTEVHPKMVSGLDQLRTLKLFGMSRCQSVNHVSSGTQR
jgi:hypothetical protein